MKAEEYIAQHGKSVEEWVTAFIEGQFGRVEMGAPRAVSEFGVPYEEARIDLDSRQAHEIMMADLKTLVQAALPTDTIGRTLVWRIRPQVHDGGPDFERNIVQLYVVRVRYRYHTLAGTTDFMLNDLKAKQVEKEWEPPGHGD